MKSSSRISGSLSWVRLKWLNSCWFCFLFAAAVSVSSSTADSYGDHCASIIPRSNITGRDGFPFLRTTRTHFTGGEKLLGKNSLLFSDDFKKSLAFRTTQNAYATDAAGVYRIEATLTFRASGWSYVIDNSTSYGESQASRIRSRRLLRFRLTGFWSESSGKLCMVGSASARSTGGKLLNFPAVLKLNFAMNTTIFTTLINGTLESSNSPTDSTYFDPISILGFPITTNYKFTLPSKEFDKGCSGGSKIPPNSLLNIRQRGVCSMLWNGYPTFEMNYSEKCDSTKNCTLFGKNSSYLPQFMSMNAIQCSEEEKSLTYLIEFANDGYAGYNQPFNPNTTFVGEGSWDGAKNRVCIVACRILDPNSPFGKSQIGDCSIRLSLWFSKIRSIKETSSILGEIWTNKTSNESGYFDQIQFQGSDNNFGSSPELKYEYTQMERVKSSCPAVKKTPKNRFELYPDGDSYEMRFDMSVRNSKEHFAWGYAVPNFVGNKSFGQYGALAPTAVIELSEIEESETGVSVVEAKPIYRGPMNISYTISLTPLPDVKWGNVLSLNSSMRYGQVKISAEGVYDSETGQLCMIGCRTIYSKESMDCEILVEFHFSSVDSRDGGFIRGVIESMRRKNDSLYFERLNITSNAYYTTEAKKSIWRMDLEITMVLISNTLSCLFLVFQLFYVRKHPDVLPLISVIMLAILTLGYMIPLVLNFEALFFRQQPSDQNFGYGNGGWIEANEVLVRVFTMVTFLLQFRLLQTVLSSRSGDQNGSWAAEIKSLLVSLPLYLLGAFLSFWLHSRRNDKLGFQFHPRNSIWGGLKSYGGLILDGFLLPQILVNVFRNSAETALCRPFYIGTTSVRVLPHAYDLYRAHNYVPSHVNGSYLYANPSADFYSTFWDVIIPLGGLAFAVVVYLQQSSGGRWFLPRRFREAAVTYEKVPELSMT